MQPTSATASSSAASPATSAAYDQLCAELRDASTLRSVSSLLGWDQETYMPHAAGPSRAEQLSLMAAIMHERLTSPRIGELLATCEADAGLKSDPAAAANLREIRRDYNKATKLPGDLVRELARVGSLSQDAWKDARAKSDFNAFKPWLEQMVSLARRKAECLRTSAHNELYDALLDEFEPGATASEIAAVFGPLRTRLSDLVKHVTGKGKRPDDAPLHIKVPESAQHAFGLEVIAALGFDLNAGRLDTTTHPFCSGLSAGDTRLTTRYRDEKFTDALYGTMHECGHGLYEQGLPKDDPARRGTPLADDISLGIHESQSRMWENFVGRSREFWAWALPIAKKHFGSAIASYDVDALFKATNITEPSFIRVEADEGTYNLHVMVRFELERAMFSGDLNVAQLPSAWNAAYKDYLGVDVPDDRRGCLQDVHWSFGLMGYFPTYTLGNLYAAQFWETINEAIPNLSDQIARGQFTDLLTWLRQNIHRHGRMYRAGELCEKITGKPLSADPLLRHLEGKLKPVYGLS